ncbi:MAG: alpha-L-rhamnosidase [Verrucomicrobia bacterium]|nr:MAG: alpha-L-rhamnosidase [Verrucomicrobiota bacterium]
MNGPGQANRERLKPCTAKANEMIELTFASTKTYADPFNDVDLDVSFTAPDGRTVRVPAFWAGEQTWKARYASSKIGRHRYRTECSDKTNRSLHSLASVIEVNPYTGDNPFYLHGPIGVAADKKHFEHADGKPFLWLADTWWMGLCQRLSWPDDFKTLTADRVEKGFNVVQIVAGLYPDMPAFDGRGANEAGFPWTTNYSRVNPNYFDAADRRIAWLVESGIAPCIVGAWGYHLPWLGVEPMKKHWRYLVARYGAYPVFWCVAGEGLMPYYLSHTKSEDAAFQKKGWTEVAAYLRGIDPFHHPISIHPTDMARRQLEDAGLLDFDMLQTGHSDRASIPNTINLVRASRAAAPPMPTINAEVCYEGILDTCFDDLQRFMVWSCLLSGTAGHTYGANGIWQVNRRDAAYGKSPHGGNWGNTSWDDAMRLPGSRQVGDWMTVDATGPTVQWGDWIWFPEGDPAKDAPVAKRYFHKTFEIPVGERIASATLWLSADDKFTAFVNGRKVGSNRDWQRPRSYNVAPHLQAGRNVLAVEAENVKAPVELNPAGLLCGLEIHFAGGDKMGVLSDATWRCARKETAGWTTPGFDDGNWSPAKAIGKYGDLPWGRLDAGDRYLMPYVAGTRERNALVIYLPAAQKATVHHLNPAEDYRAEFFNPVTGTVTLIGFVRQSSDWAAPACPDESHDWVLYLLATKDTK